MPDRAASDAWAPLAKRFVEDHYGSLRGRVRTHVIHEHLSQHITPPPGRVVDVGGGAGNQSVPLAQAGYDVTIVDPSAAMLERAAECLANEPDEVAARVRLIEASGRKHRRHSVASPSTRCSVTGCSCTSTTRNHLLTRSANSPFPGAWCRSWRRTLK